MAEVAALQFADLEFHGDSDGEAGDRCLALLEGTRVQMVQVQNMFMGDINPVRVNDAAVFRVTGSAVDAGVVVGRYNDLVDP